MVCILASSKYEIILSYELVIHKIILIYYELVLFSYSSTSSYIILYYIICILYSSTSS